MATHIDDYAYHVIAESRVLYGHFFPNYTFDDLLHTLIIPFVNQQTTLHDPDKAIINLAATTYLRVYRTNSKIPAVLLSTLSVLGFARRYIRLTGVNCTKEVLESARIGRASRQSKSLLQTAMGPQKQQVFVIMAFGDKQLESAYHGVVRPIAAKHGLSALRVDELQDSGQITDQILEEIGSSAVVLCDLSRERPNCYYEAGFAHALGKEIVFSIRKEDRVHFDSALSHM